MIEITDSRGKTSIKLAERLPSPPYNGTVIDLFNLFQENNLACLTEYTDK